MKSDVTFFYELAFSFLPFIVFVILNNLVNIKKENRCRQYSMPLYAVSYCILVILNLDKLTSLVTETLTNYAATAEQSGVLIPQEFINNPYSYQSLCYVMVVLNTAILLVYVILKMSMNLVYGKVKIAKYSLIGRIIELFYTYDDESQQWYIKEHFGQACTYVKTAYYSCCFASGLAVLISCYLLQNHMIQSPFHPVFAVLILGEIAFFMDGLGIDDRKNQIKNQADDSSRIAMYPLLRKPLRKLFGDKLSAEGTTVNNGGVTVGAIEDILVNLEQSGGHIGRNYAAFIRKRMDAGLKPNMDYVRCGYDLAIGKSLLFNTPFYDKLNPYAFYAMNRELLTGGKILIVLGRHGTESDLKKWCESGIMGITNVPDLWKIETLTTKKVDEENLPDIGIITRSGVHDLDIHKNNLPFLRNVSFVMIVEPSRLVTTAQIGLNLLIKCCSKERPITFCSVDRNCYGLVDALSHILMTNITEVSATEYPHGMSSYMYWTSDDDYLQHRILPGVSRYLGMGTELSMVALKNQVKHTTWYGGDAFPVLDSRWIAKQYYHDLLDYAQLPTNQETFDQCFKASYNMCDERVSDYSFVTVEDDRNNLFETRRNFATIAEKQGFVNVISSEYMLREYMSSNNEVFTADAKAIPYITADYARTKRNSILSLCLLLCVNSVKKETLLRQLVMLNIDTTDPIGELWKEICFIFSNDSQCDKQGTPILSVKAKDGRTVKFEKASTIVYRREYDVESGKFESVYAIENTDFSRIILDDLQNASYIAEEESKDIYIGTELKGHVYQKYLPGQFFTLNGKYYEMVATALDNRILVRRASDHIEGRLSYRQVRNYTISHLEDCPMMGAYKSVNNIDRTYLYADFAVETPGYWKLHAFNDFDHGDLVKVSGVPTREYHHKQILRFDFSKFGDAFTDSIRMTLTNLMNEVFVTLFADNQAFITAVTPGRYDAPLTYSLDLKEGLEGSDKCIYIIEDSQLDIGLLVAVERNITRIMQIITDYLQWNDEQIEESIQRMNEPDESAKSEVADLYDGETVQKKKGLFGRLVDKVKNLFKRKKKDPENKKPAELPVQQKNTPEETQESLNKAEEPETEEPAEESAEEPVTEESSEETVEEPETEEPAEETIEEPETEESSEETVEEPETEESSEEPVEEPETEEKNSQ